MTPAQHTHHLCRLLALYISEASHAIGCISQRKAYYRARTVVIFDRVLCDELHRIERALVEEMGN